MVRPWTFLAPYPVASVSRCCLGCCWLPCQWQGCNANILHADAQFEEDLCLPGEPSLIGPLVSDVTSHKPQALH
eukprot:766651-Pelagomonas_calceolata.AAC.3